MTRFQFFAAAPKTRAEFVQKYKEDNVFRNYANVYGITVVGDCVIFSNGRIADRHIK